MNTTSQFASAVQELIRREPALLDELQHADGQARIVECIAAAGKRHEINIDADELAAHLRIVSDDAVPGALNDEALEDVAGGTGANFMYPPPPPDEDKATARRVIVVGGVEFVVWSTAPRER